ncbi:MAG: putative toxin-antitoxin system toxin component, PIN family [Chloroflexi bacterium]|nr:MAG: putative toxin-antitoxin system toxin component, PIN family [Chloroflexota bacterium]
MLFRVLIDANIWLSYLLAPDQEQTITLVVRACLSDAVELIVPPELLEEIVTILTTRRYFLERVSQERREELVRQLQLYHDLAGSLEAPPPYTRDRKDDYLIAYGLLNDVNYLITGDKDLLVLRRIAALEIVDPEDFLTILSARLP